MARSSCRSAGQPHCPHCPVVALGAVRFITCAHALGSCTMPFFVFPVSCHKPFASFPLDVSRESPNFDFLPLPGGPAAPRQHTLAGEGTLLGFLAPFSVARRSVILAVKMRATLPLVALALCAHVAFAGFPVPSSAQCAAVSSPAPCGLPGDGAQRCAWRGCCWNASHAENACFYPGGNRVPVEHVHVIQVCLLPFAFSSGGRV
jgi:hypothetical protein